MAEEERYTIEEAQALLARQINGRVWGLLDKSDRSPAEDAEMAHAAHASLYHWLQVGTGLHHQRGEWLVARVYTVLGRAVEAVHHANRCLALTEEHKDLMADFDLAFAYEGIARANALAGNLAEARRYATLAEAAGQQIADAEDKTIFFDDFRAGNWYGFKLG